MVAPAKLMRNGRLTSGARANTLPVTSGEKPFILPVGDIGKLLEELPTIRVVAIRPNFLEVDLVLRKAWILEGLGMSKCSLRNT